MESTKSDYNYLRYRSGYGSKINKIRAAVEFITPDLEILKITETRSEVKVCIICSCMCMEYILKFYDVTSQKSSSGVKQKSGLSC